MAWFRRGDAGADERRAAFAARVAEHDRAHPGYAAAWQRFAATLLAIGGTDVVPPGSADPLVDLLRTEGGVVPAPDVVPRAGEPGDCHVNAVRLWRTGDAVAIGTGYALSADGLWREHSWGVDAAGRIVETTAERVTYYGVTMTGERAQWFADWIDPAPPH